jgi:hypothetical protein
VLRRARAYRTADEGRVRGSHHAARQMRTC